MCDSWGHVENLWTSLLILFKTMLKHLKNELSQLCFLMIKVLSTCHILELIQMKIVKCTHFAK